MCPNKKEKTTNNCSGVGSFYFILVLFILLAIILGGSFY